MGVELILFTYAAGLAPLLYGVYAMAVGRIRLSRRGGEPILGFESRLWGLFCILLAAAWFLAITWAWGKYGRV